MVVLKTVLVVSWTDPEPPLAWTLPPVALFVAIEPPTVPLEEKEEDELPPKLLVTLVIVDGAGGAALSVLSAVELRTEDKETGSSVRHLILSLEPLLSV